MSHWPSWASLPIALLACGSNAPGAGSSDATTGVDGHPGDDGEASSAPDSADAVADRSADDVSRTDGGVDGAVPSEASATGADAGSEGSADVTTDEGLSDVREGGLRACDPHCVDVLTWHNDNARTGQNLSETVLTPANVNAANFGRLFVLPVDGKVDAQPLVVSAVNVVGKGTHDVVYVATEHDSLYAFDAVGNTGANASALWQVSLLGNGETTSEDRFNCGQVTPEIGVTSTPVVDLASGTLYIVAMSKNGSGYFQRLHAIDITSGAERFGGPVDIHATYPGTGLSSVSGSVVFDPGLYKERAALLLLNGAVYVTWASHCDMGSYTGWVMAYDATTLSQRGVLNITPNGGAGAIWASGAGPAADGDGNIYFLAGNGTFDPALDSTGFPAQHDFGNGMLKIATNGPLAVTDYFATWNTIAQSAVDLDFGSGGVMLLPDEVGSAGHPHLIVGAGKDGNIYLVDRDNMGKWNGADSGSNAQIVQEVTGAVPNRVFGGPAYFDHSIYYADNGDSLKRFALDPAHVVTPPAASTPTSFFYPGATPSVSANGAAANPASTAIVWALLNTSPAVLHAYSPLGDLTQPLYTSAQADAGRDTFGDGNKYIVPTIANGHVYAATTTGVGVFGLLPSR